MKRPILFLILVLLLAWNMQARKWRITDSIEQAKTFIYMYYKEYGVLPNSLEELEQLVYIKTNIKDYFENQKESGFNYSLTTFTENLLWLSIEKEKENQSFLWIVDKQQIIVFGGADPLYRYTITSSGEIADFHAYDEKYEVTNDYEVICVPMLRERARE